MHEQLVDSFHRNRFPLGVLFGLESRCRLHQRRHLGRHGAGTRLREHLLIDQHHQVLLRLRVLLLRRSHEGDLVRGGCRLGKEER